jgi:hypothetical protein
MSEPPQTPWEIEWARIQDEMAQAQAVREREEKAITELLDRTGGQRREGWRSVVFTVRLDPAEVDALERRAALRGMKPRVLARNLLRNGLREGCDERLSAAVDRVEAALREVRELSS